MGNNASAAAKQRPQAAETAQYVSFDIAGQVFGVPVFAVQDVLKRAQMAHVPLAPHTVRGSMNLRGRIVTVIDMRAKLGLPALENAADAMHVVVEHADELYSLMVDNVREVMTLPVSIFEKTPGNIDEGWKDISDGVYRLKDELLVVIDLPSALKF